MQKLNEIKEKKENLTSETKEKWDVIQESFEESSKSLKEGINTLVSAF